MILLLLIYDILFILGLLFFLPYLSFRKKINLEALGEKLTVYPSKVKKAFSQIEGSIWIQAVSVGEVSLIKKLVEELKTLTSYKIVISTTTLTGRKVATKLYPGLLILYFPYDFGLLVRRAIKFIKPKLFISIETEIWPNLYYHLKKKNVPSVILNGRISDKAFRWYRRAKFLTERIFQNVSLVGAQDEFYKERFIFLGLEENKIAVTGNLKFTALSVDDKYLTSFKKKYSPLLGKPNRLLIIAASTHFPEEEIFLEIYNQLYKKYPNITLLIAPRHIERVPYVEGLIASRGFKPIRISKPAVTRDSRDIYILDTVGDLFYFYSLADICFVGGSLANYGGHNILEPLYVSKPTVFGPFMYNFKEIERKVLERCAAVRVNSKEELRRVLDILIKEPQARKELALKAKGIFEEAKINLKRNLELIFKCLN
jgi:3-deoxy-D-manno-octulosonic-acid transferase